MSRGLPLALAALCLGGCALKKVCGDGSGANAAVAHPRAGFFVFAHAHNDYEHARPLLDALEHHFYSVEADVWFQGGELRVSHDGGASKGTLRALYLDPLKARVEQNGGSVYGDGAPFTLWVDLKASGAELEDALAAQLGEYAMLTSFGDGTSTPGAVTLVLTGDAGAKKRLADRASPRRWTRDSNDFAPDDPPADGRWTHYALNYGSYVGWNGEGEPPADAVERLRCIAAGAHAGGRKVRLYASPEKPGYWKAALDAGIDFLNTDDLAGLEALLRDRK